MIRVIVFAVTLFGLIALMLAASFGSKRILNVAAVLLVPIVLVTLNVHLLLSDAYVLWSLDRVHLPATLTEAERDARALAITDFVAGRNTRFRDLRSALSVQPASEAENRGAIRDDHPSMEPERLPVEDEIDHLMDVRVVIPEVRIILLAFVLAMVGLVRLSRESEHVSLVRRQVARGGLLTLALVALVGIGIATGWERTFVLFHEILFPQGNWAFPADSLLIQIFPNQFWFEAAAALVALTTVEAAALVSWGRRGDAPARPKPERRVPVAADASP